MKVIEKGTGQKGWSIEATCTGAGNRGGGCNAKLLVEQGDLFATTSTCRDETNHYVTFECVECGVWTDLPDSKQPPYNITATLPNKPPSKRGNSSR